MNQWLQTEIANRFPPATENNSREIVRRKFETFIRTGHPKVGQELQALMPDLDLQIDVMVDHYGVDQTGDERGSQA